MHVLHTLKTIGQKLARVRNLTVKQRSDFQIRFASLQNACSSLPLGLLPTRYLPQAERSLYKYVYPGIYGKSRDMPLKGTCKALPATSVRKPWPQENKTEGLDRMSPSLRGFWDVAKAPVTFPMPFSQGFQDLRANFDWLMIPFPC